jgi:hypothetical protein
MPDSSIVAAIDTVTQRITGTFHVGYNANNLIVDSSKNTLYAVSDTEGVTVIATGPRAEPSSTTTTASTDMSLPSPTPVSPSDGAVYSDTRTIQFI